MPGSAPAARSLNRYRLVAHDGSEGLSPDGWLPDRISVGVLARVFTPELVDAAVDAAGAREQRRRLCRRGW